MPVRAWNRRIQEILFEDREPIDEGHRELPNLQGNICFNHVNFSYNAEKPALKDVSFSANAGQTIALIGSTGSGKSSLINLLPRFYEYDSGSITLDGVELKEISRDFLRNNIGIVEQEPFLFSATIAENIAYGVEEKPSDEKIISAAKAAGIHDTILHSICVYSISTISISGAIYSFFCSIFSPSPVPKEQHLY